jgi:hypothetical protein
LFFLASGFNFENSLSITLEGNQQNCPRCGSWAKVLDGTYNFFGNVVEIINAPQTTLNHLQELKTLLEQVESGDKDPEEAANDIEGLSPQLSAIADEIRQLTREVKEASKPSFHTWLITLIAAIGLAIDFKEEVKDGAHVHTTERVVIEQTLDNLNRRNSNEEIKQLLQRCDPGRQQERKFREIGDAVFKPLRERRKTEK